MQFQWSAGGAVAGNDWSDLQQHLLLHVPVGEVLGSPTSLIRIPMWCVTSAIYIHFLLGEVSRLWAVSRISSDNHHQGWQQSKQWDACKCYGQRHSRLTCKRRNVKCNKSDKVDHIQSVSIRKQASLTSCFYDNSQLSPDLQSLNLASISPHSHDHITHIFLVNSSVKHSFITGTSKCGFVRS